MAFNRCNASVIFESKTPILLCKEREVEYEYQGITYTYTSTSCDEPRFNESIYVPCGSLDAYKNANGWEDYKNQIKYVPSPYKITIKEAENGIVETPWSINVCDEVKITAKPNPGYYFVEWADGNIDNPRYIELTQDTTMEALFEVALTGFCGKDSVLTWTYEPATKLLNVTGKGALSENYTYGRFMDTIIIGNEITVIGEYAFYGCSNLKHVILGSSVKVLEEGAFYYCSSIETIICYSQRPPTVNNYALYGLEYSTIIYVPADYLDTYIQHDVWGLYDVRPLDDSTAIDEINEIEGGKGKPFNKYIHNGQLLIEKNGKTYYTTGIEVK